MDRGRELVLINDIRREGLESFVTEAVAMTKYFNEDPYRTLPDPKYYEGRESLDLHMFDPAYKSLTSDERVAIARRIEDAALAESERIISCTSSFSDSYFETVKVHSNGFEGYRLGTSFSIGAEATVRDDSGRRPMNGRSLQQKSSFLDGKLGKKIGSDKLTIIDDPFIDFGLGSRLFDGEGVSTKRRVMIDKGVLKSFYIDTYYGKKLGMEPTSGSTTNLVFDKGEQSLDEMIKGIRRGILVTTFIGGNSNATTCDFSYGIMGVLIENGRAVKPVNEMNISGNLAEFWNQLVMVGNDEYVYSAWRRPSMYFKDVYSSGV